MLAAALLTIPTIVIDETRAPRVWRHVAEGLDWAVWLAFAIEAVVLFAVAEDRWRWLREHPLEVGVVLVTPPFVPLVMQSLRVARFFRLLRLVRLGQPPATCSRSTASAGAPSSPRSRCSAAAR